MKQNVSQKLRLMVLGATGATGAHAVAEGLKRSHEVVAPVRRPGSLAPTPALTEVEWRDVSDRAALVRALVGVDVVVSTLGGAGRGATTVCTDAMATTVSAMAEAGVRRLIVVSAHGVLETHDRSLYSMAVWAGVGGKMGDKESMEPLVTSSGLEWTIVRPPMLRDTAATGGYRVGEDLPIRLWSTIGRADLAAFLIAEAEEARFVGRYPRIRR